MVGKALSFIRTFSWPAQPHWSRDFGEIGESWRVSDKLSLQIYCGSVTPPVLVTVGATGHAGTDSREAESENISPRLY